MATQCEPHPTNRTLHTSLREARSATKQPRRTAPNLPFFTCPERKPRWGTFRERVGKPPPCIMLKKEALPARIPAGMFDDRFRPNYVISGDIGPPRKQSFSRLSAPSGQSPSCPCLRSADIKLSASRKCWLRGECPGSLLDRLEHALSAIGM